jgi:hypothetical protein
VSQSKKDQRKERVLHTRVSEELDEELKEKAAGLGVSVSNLVRNILLNTLGMVEDIVADSSNIARAAKHKSHPHNSVSDDESPAASQILGWQILALNLNAVCERCNHLLPRGSKAAMAVYDGRGPRVFRCIECIPDEQKGIEA